MTAAFNFASFYLGLLVGFGACTLLFTLVAALWPGFFCGGTEETG